jgi:hypothetical protein
MPDSWWEESPIIQQTKATGKAEGLREGIVDAIKLRFPHLTDLARQKVNQINDPQKLHNLFVQLFAAPDEASVRSLLASTVA